MRRNTFLMIGVLPAFVSGCFSVKDTDGLQHAFRDMERVYPNVVAIKKSDLSDETKNRLKSSYEEGFKADVNSYLKGAKTRAADYLVDEPNDSYPQQAAAAANKFIQDAHLALGARPQVAAWAPIAALVIDAIWKLHGDAQRQAYERFLKTIDEYMAKDWDSVRVDGPPGR